MKMGFGWSIPSSSHVRLAKPSVFQDHCFLHHQAKLATENCDTTIQVTLRLLKSSLMIRDGLVSQIKDLLDQNLRHFTPWG